MRIQKVIKAIRKEGDWYVIPEGINKITLIRQYGYKYPKIISFSLVASGKGLYLEHPNYKFISVVSHFKSVQNDIRLSLNKTYLSSIIRTLKRTGVWQSVMNKNFLKVNDNNPKSNKGKVRNELKNLLAKI